MTSQAVNAVSLGVFRGRAEGTGGELGFSKKDAVGVRLPPREGNFCQLLWLVVGDVGAKGRSTGSRTARGALL